ncbi:glycosyltransferase [bacterium]|nr:glycosyltransferase [bacterium]
MQSEDKNRKNPKVTVLMPVYNGVLYLEEAIESILNQTFSDFEFLIIDDASTDHSLEMIRSYNDSRIRLVQNKKNIGQTASLNKGLHLARGEFIARLDQDDVSLLERLKEQVEYLDRHPEITIVSTWEETITSTGRKVREWKREIENYGDFLGYILLGLCPVWHPSVMFRKDNILKLGCFDTTYGPAEDYELWGRIAINRMGAAFVPKILVQQRVHEARQSVLHNDKQVDSTKRSHRNFVKRFAKKDKIDDLAAVLRLDDNLNGLKNRKKSFIKIAGDLATMLESIKTEQNLSEREVKALKKRIYRRVGYGFRYVKFIAFLPGMMFLPIFYCLSPLLIPQVKGRVSTLYKNIQKLKSSFT